MGQMQNQIANLDCKLIYAINSQLDIVKENQKIRHRPIRYASQPSLQNPTYPQQSIDLTAIGTGEFFL